MDQFRSWTTPDGRQWTEDYFELPFNLGNVPNTGANTSGQIVQNVQADGYFQWEYSKVFGNLHGQTPPFLDSVLLPININIADGGSGRTLFFAPTPINAVAGTGKQPYYLPVPRIFLPKSTITLTFASFDLVAETYDNVVFVMGGRKVFDVTPPGTPLRGA